MKPLLIALSVLAPLALATGASVPAAGTPPPTYVWRSLKVGGGGFIPGVVFGRAEGGLVYARSDMGGAFRWDARAGRWIPLEDAFAEGIWFGVESIAPDPVDPDVAYAAVGVSRQGDATTAAIMPRAIRQTGPSFTSRIDVARPGPDRLLVAIGDSITEGGLWKQGGDAALGAHPR